MKRLELPKKTFLLFSAATLLLSTLFGASVGKPITSSSLIPLESQIVGMVNGTNIYNYDLELENIALDHSLSNYSFRSAGSGGANATADWILEQFGNFGLETYKEPFQFTKWDVLSKPTFIIDDDGNSSTTDDQTTINSFQCAHYSWPAPEGGVFSDLVTLRLPPAADLDELGMNPINLTEWNQKNTTNKILLIGREVRMVYSWELTFKNKLTAQPPAAVIYTWWYDWMSFVPDFFSSAGGRPLSQWGPYYWNLEIPVGFINYDEGLWIRNREGSMNVSAKAKIESVIGQGSHYNVIGKISGIKYPDKFVIVSSHYDTVMCSGFCDNGAGTAGVIELARIFAEVNMTGLLRPKYTILFVPFASEEIGLVGSINYVMQHKTDMNNIVAVINMDCIGSNELSVSGTNPATEFDLDEVVLKAADDLGISASLESPGGSDQETFRDPSWANSFYGELWGLDAGISDAEPVESSTGLASNPSFFSHKWDTGSPGWIHTSYDNSTSTTTLSWVEADDLEDHLKVAALSLMRIQHTREYTLAIHSSPTGVAFTVDAISRISPWSGTYEEGASATLVMPETYDGYVWSHWLEDEDTNRFKTVTMDTNVTLTAVFALDTVPPTISIVSPENKTYAKAEVPLTFIADESTSWIGYSLDGQANITIAENATLTWLSEKMHSLVVYARDIAGNIGSSDMVYFTTDTIPPNISIASPENEVYDTNDIPLTFTVDEQVSWIAYSLNGRANKTIAGNTTLTDLSDGSHSIIVCAKDAAGNIRASEIIYFTIETESEEAFPLWTVAATVIVAIGGTAFLVYFTKFRKTTQKAI